MKIYEIFGETPETKEYEPAVFIVGGFVEVEIYAFNNAIGWVKHHFGINELNAHLDRMKAEGFTVRELKTVCN